MGGYWLLDGVYMLDFWYFLLMNILILFILGMIVMWVYYVF